MWDSLTRYSDSPELIPLEPEAVQQLIAMLSEYRESMLDEIEGLENIDPGDISELQRQSSIEAYGLMLAAMDLYIMGLETGDPVYFAQAETIEAEVYMIFR